MPYTTEGIRNVAILGHGSSGKTSLAESMLFLTGGTDRLGRIADGNTVGDSDSEEIKRQITIYLATTFAEAVTGGRLLKSAAFVATAVSVISAAFGVLLMFYMCWSGAFLAARPGNLLLFMLSMLGAVLVVCFYVKCRK